MTQLTDTQKTALAKDRNLSVTAGAGTGKTLILVERYLDILLNENIDIREILAITFTNKAAAEMLERAAEIVDERIKSADDEEIKRKLVNYRNRLSSAYISTIHSFCLRILREYPVECDLDPDFVLLNEYQATLLIEETIVEEIDLVNHEEEIWLELFRLFGLDTIKEMIRFALTHRYEMDSLASLYDAPSADLLYNRICSYFLDSVREAFDNTLLRRIHSKLDQILYMDLSQTENFPQAKYIVETLKHFYSLHPDKIDYWKYLFQIARLFTSSKETAYKDLRFLGTEKAWPQEVHNNLIHLSSLVPTIAKWKKENPITPPSTVDHFVIHQLQGFYHLYRRILARLNEKKKAQAALDYDDLLIRVLELLGNKEQIRQKIASQFRYIMVDEFQDTNILQWKIISLLTEQNWKKFFIVGDPKQSIYGFRNADIRVFNMVADQFTHENSKAQIHLTESFRFKEELNSFINFIFARILNKEKANPWAVEYHPLTVHRDDLTGGKIEFALFDSEADENANQAEFIANRIKILKESPSVAYGDIAVLLRTRNHLNEIEGQLRKNDIAFKTIGGIGFYQRQEIYDIYHLLRFLLDPHDDIALIAVLRSPLANLSDEGLFFLSVNKNTGSYWQRVLKYDNPENLPKNDWRNILLFRNRAQQWIQRRDRIGFAELLNEIFYDSQYRSIISASLNGRQLLANIDKIVDLSQDFEQKGLSSINDFIGSLKKLINQQVKEGEAQTDLEDMNTVKVMTIHQAKGLEFPFVFLPYLEQKLMAPTQKTVLMDEQLGLSAAIRNKTFSEDISLEESYCLLDFLKMNQKKKELAELKRLFYVGCTRARDQIILSATIKQGQIPINTPLIWLLDALEMKTDGLNEGFWEYAENKKIRIWRNYESYEQETSQIQNVKKSLKAIRKMPQMKEVKEKKPLHLFPISDQPKGEIFSATQLLIFSSNKEEFFKRYHLGFFEGDYDRITIGGFKEDLALLKGKLLHKYFETYPNFNFENSLYEMEINDESLIMELKQQVAKIGDRISNSQQLRRIISAKEFKNEVQILMRLDMDFLLGTLDRIYKNENGQWEVIDYKTNRIASNQIARQSLKYQYQMEIYALLLSRLYPDQEFFPVSLYFTEPDQFYQYKFFKAAIEKIHDRVCETIKEIKKYPPYQPLRGS